MASGQRRYTDKGIEEDEPVDLPFRFLVRFGGSFTIWIVFCCRDEFDWSFSLLSRGEEFDGVFDSMK